MNIAPGKPILVVEDSSTQAVALETLLENAGYTVTVASSGEAAIESVRGNHVALVLTDIVMPGIDGYELCRRIKSEWSDIPVILLTSLTDPLAIVRGLECGADHYATKPYDPVQLLERVVQVLGRAGDAAIHSSVVHVELNGTPFTISATKEQILELLVSSYGDLVRTSDVVRAAEQRARFLADAGVLLSTSLDPREILGSLARLCVPYMADLCIVDLVEENGTVSRLAAASTDPRLGPDAQQILESTPSASPDHPYWRVITSGEALMLTDAASGLVEFADTPSGDPVVIAPPTCAVVAPLCTREQVLGALTFISFGGRQTYSSEDLGLASDVARRAALALENAQLYQQAQRATQARDDVLALVSHDLRSPLGTVHMSASFLLELLETPGSTPPFDAQLKTIIRSVTRADRLIGDLLDVSRIESGTLEVEHSALDAGSLMSETIEENRPIAQEKGIELVGDWTGPALMIAGDRDRLSQLFSNLIGNAIKFTPAGGRITVTGVPGPAIVTFSVSDTGPGIAAEHLPHLFDRFWQANKATRSGAGLGLSIAKGIAEAHRGYLKAESASGAGATFSFGIPVWR